MWNVFHKFRVKENTAWSLSRFLTLCLRPVLGFEMGGGGRLRRQKNPLRPFAVMESPTKASLRLHPFWA